MTDLFPWILCSLCGAMLLVLGLHTHRLRQRVDQLNATFPEQTRARAQEREALLQTLLDQSPAALMFYSDTGRIAFANLPARELFFEGANLEGENFLRLAARAPSTLRPVLLGRGDHMASFELEEGRETYQFVRRVFAHAGEPHTLLVVRHVTRQVTRQELDVLKRVVRLLSHEVNNALAPVSSLIHSARQIVKAGERLDRLERVFATVDERAKHLSQFIAGYATLARLPPPSPQTQRWEPVIERLRVLYPRAQMSVDPEVTGHFDAGQVEQALINLLKNAHEAGGAPEDISLAVRRTEEASEIEIVDRGPGFSPEALEQATLPFFTTKPGGSGVGLALVREVLEAHGGTLRLGVREGGGALIYLRIFDRRSSPPDMGSRARLTLTRA